jgi:DUF917 family protein
VALKENESLYKGAKRAEEEVRRLNEELEMHTGLDQREIQEEIDKKKSILDWMVKNKLRQVEEVGKLMNLYYMDQEAVIDAVTKDKEPKTLLEQDSSNKQSKTLLEQY